MIHSALFPFALGIIMGVITLRRIIFARRLQRTGVEVLGQVVRQREVSSRSGPYFIPTIRFTTWLGQLIEAESAGQSNNLEFFDGDEVIVFYDPNHPAIFLLAQELNLRSKYAQLALVAFLFMAALASAMQ
ncbi:DUF3592 domain-containing protein [Hymenobacter cheonanensis]|uniref:DUF3592 domain-containing protein n=1 Tax=Hymenobacter sp. CA2-7 TaxID=3063993 RepID=UPI002713524F|nr:DUF3592 domain-containing protein [Hymenobacter sp. CA2-7]MDO7884288.1 DUF3592 domain-containing protein [Hymenobacter sp. CA2-7]